mgnify:FL=1
MWSDSLFIHDNRMFVECAFDCLVVEICSKAISYNKEKGFLKGILADYLRKKGSEVINMLQAEYDYELDIEVQREEAYEDGLRAGGQSGREKGIQELPVYFKE